MGLDNGIEVRRTPYTSTIPELQQFTEEWDDKHECNFSICYWRKCYNIRSMIFDVAKGIHNAGISDPLTKEDVDNIIKGLQSFNSRNWQEDGGSIWDWNDEDYPYSDKIKQDIKNLQTFRRLMDKYDLEVYFYDSY